MDLEAVLAAFDEQVRRSLADPGTEVAADGRIIRVVSPGDGWCGVAWTDLAGADDLDDVIAAQIRRFDGLDRSWEWKHYSYDRPSDLPDHLGDAGFVKEPVEAMVVAEVADLPLDDMQTPEGVRLLSVDDDRGIRLLVEVHDAVFGGDHSAIGRRIEDGLARDPPTVQAVVALVDGKAVAGGRVEFHAGTDFASLWGGGTLPEWRGRGLFRSLVGRRAMLARERGFRYLQVDASPQSEPILERLGFVRLASTTPYVFASNQSDDTCRR